jgi:Flp pilus assembly protein TadD
MAGQSYSSRSPRSGGKALALALSLAASTILAGCATDNRTTGSINRSGGKSVEQMSADELAQATREYGATYAKQPKDKAVGMKYASLLRMAGRNDQALAVMKSLAIAHATDRDVLAAYGKALASAGELNPALDAIRRAQTPNYPDWKLLSAEAAILDQLGDPSSARIIYKRALDIAPGEPSILSNIGMSYLLEGDLKTAETYMRQASERPGADSSIRQNLALAVGLQGRFSEAEQIARAELAPDQAEANVAYLKQMLAQQNAWSQLESDGKKTN